MCFNLFRESQRRLLEVDRDFKIDGTALGGFARRGEVLASHRTAEEAVDDVISTELRKLEDDEHAVHGALSSLGV